MIRVFVRNWWKRENGKLVPNPRARKTTLDWVYTANEARSLCWAYNETHKSGGLSRKAEWMAE